MSVRLYDHSSGLYVSMSDDNHNLGFKIGEKNDQLLLLFLMILALHKLLLCWHVIIFT